jgi:dihydrofolate synthase / folylpolyglutamate synthase
MFDALQNCGNFTAICNVFFSCDMNQSLESTRAQTQALLNELFSLHRFGIQPGLETITTLAGVCGNPHRAYPTIHVAGTNGKGTVCSLLASILMSAGYRVGLYTSPHVRTFHERIRVNGAMITDEEILVYADKIMPTARATQATFFEVTTAIMYQHFADAQVDIAIIETGMGGRLDSTNIVQPLLSIITSIDFDHTEFLGNTLEAIAFEKAGIIKERIPVLIAEPRKELTTLFMNIAVEREAPIGFLHSLAHITSASYTKQCTMTISAKVAGVMYSDLHVPVAGKHQEQNVLTAIAGIAMMQKITGNRFVVSESALREGIARLHAQSGLQARIQCIRHEPPIILDVGHNLAGVKALRETLIACGFAEKSFRMMIGAMRDKPVKEMVRAMRGLCAECIAVQPMIERAMPASEIAEYAHKAKIASVRVMPSIAEAMRYALSDAMPLVIVGSFYTADEAVVALHQQGIL